MFIFYYLFPFLIRKIFLFLLRFLFLKFGIGKGINNKKLIVFCQFLYKTLNREKKMKNKITFLYLKMKTENLY